MAESEDIQKRMANISPQWPNLMDGAAKHPDSPEGWPWVNPWPQDKTLTATKWIDNAQVDAAFSGWKKGDPMGYVKEEAPEFSLPTYGGERYEAMVPDTLEIQERAALGVHALTEQSNPDADQEIYGNIDFTSQPIAMSHGEGGPCFAPKFMEALITCRLISGREQNKHIEEKWLESMLRMQGDDGLLYIPTKGRPWFALINSMGDIDGDQIACPFDLGGYLVVLTAYYRLTGDELWRKTAERLVDGLRTISADEQDTARFRRFYYGPSDRADSTGPDYVPHLGAAGWVLNGLGKFYRASGYEPARELGEKLSRSLMKRLASMENLHWHTNTQSLIGILELALATSDQEALDFAHEHLEFLKKWGNTTIGFFPEIIGVLPDFRGAESCNVAGMIISALKLAESGMDEYWDQAEAWVRNLFSELQLLDTTWIERMPMRDFIPGFTTPHRSVIDDRYMSTDRVVSRIVGSFAPSAPPNDWARNYLGVTGCCTGNGNRAWYHIWENILHHDDGKLRVNMLLNRGSKWADVDSHIPYTGQVDVKVKEPLDLSIRMPQWVSPSQIRISVNGTDRNAKASGRYAEVGDVKPGDVVTMTFPISERLTSQWVQGHQYNLILKGNDVVSIDPVGTIAPIFLRHHYRANGTRWHKIERFVADKLIYH